MAPYLSTHSSIKIGQNQIFFGFSDPPSVSAVQKVCRPIPSKRNFVCVLSISSFALLTTLVTLIHRHLSHSKRNSETVILSQIQSKVKISQFTLPKPLPPNSCVSCLSGMEQHSLAGFIAAQFHKIYTSQNSTWSVGPAPGSVSKS